MALLSDGSIRKMVETYDAIVPFRNDQLQPCSYDVTLGSSYIQYQADDPDYAFIDAETKLMCSVDKLEYHDDAIVLNPNEFILASTEEVVTIPNGIACRFEGKSSLGRLGLLTHVSAGFVDPGFHGQITLEIANLNSVPVILHKGMRIGQLCFFKLDHCADRPYGSSSLGSHYQGQMGPTASR